MTFRVSTGTQKLRHQRFLSKKHYIKLLFICYQLQTDTNNDNNLQK